MTLYGEDPARRPDIYGKVGNSGVSFGGDARRRQEALLGLRPADSLDLGVDDHQRTGADAAGDFFMNAPSTSSVELHIREQGLEERSIEAKIDAIFAAKGVGAPATRASFRRARRPRPALLGVRATRWSMRRPTGSADPRRHC